MLRDRPRHVAHLLRRRRRLDQVGQRHRHALADTEEEEPRRERQARRGLPRLARVEHGGDRDAARDHEQERPQQGGPMSHSAAGDEPGRRRGGDDQPQRHGQHGKAAPQRVETQRRLQEDRHQEQDTRGHQRLHRQGLRAGPRRPVSQHRDPHQRISTVRDEVALPRGERDQDHQPGAAQYEHGRHPAPFEHRVPEHLEVLPGPDQAVPAGQQRPDDEEPESGRGQHRSQDVEPAILRRNAASPRFGDPAHEEQHDNRHHGSHEERHPPAQETGDHATDDGACRRGDPADRPDRRQRPRPRGAGQGVGEQGKHGRDHERHADPLEQGPADQHEDDTRADGSDERAEPEDLRAQDEGSSVAEAASELAARDQERGDDEGVQRDRRLYGGQSGLQIRDYGRHGHVHGGRVVDHQEVLDRKGEEQGSGDARSRCAGPSAAVHVGMGDDPDAAAPARTPTAAAAAADTTERAMPGKAGATPADDVAVPRSRTTSLDSARGRWHHDRPVSSTVRPPDGPTARIGDVPGSAVRRRSRDSVQSGPQQVRRVEPGVVGQAVC